MDPSSVMSLFIALKHNNQSINSSDTLVKTFSMYDRLIIESKHSRWEFRPPNNNKDINQAFRELCRTATFEILN